ncbi:zinc ribbon domain-containing protein [Halorubrum sp. Atlit-26R]|uniref:double zinc ribbon domain-containing protein n=1 Tax=Halorubrum sp. Atlit-26R TaxID=2282128 RepID=UPI000EF197B4|nr:zinc ribbon domain-containing protein [Halorubrum sp. Atlit-26R]RLM76554.1 CopG family transcriptional regulator [Halorubrum sp. Atlit-26R]
MSKITFRADDDLVDRLEACDASKSEVMREALRTHLDGEGDASDASDAATGSVDDALADRVDDLIAERLDAALDERLGPAGGAATRAYTSETTGDINVNVTLDAPSTESDDRDDEVRVTRETAGETEPSARKTDPSPGAQTRENACGGCGETVPSDHVYCPNCGEKQSHRAFCECGDELRTDWAFCPGCGRRTPAADVLKDQ